jgi:FixJ family two-component response regulator
LETINSPPVVAIIDGDPDVLDGLNLTLSSFGYRPALFASAEEIPRRGGNI